MQTTGEAQIPRRPQFTPVNYGRHVGSVGQIDKASDLEVRRVDGALEVNTDHEGIEVHSPIDWEPRPSIPVSALTELPSHKSPVERSESNIVGEVIKKHIVCGWLHRRGQMILAAVLMLIVVAIVGAVTGTLMSRKSRQSPAPLSNLAAANWTTAANVTIYVVFSQEVDGSLIAHRQEGQEWATVNISHIFQESGISLGIRTSTPLAAAAISSPTKSADLGVNELSLFYLTPNSNITQIVTHNDSLLEWEWGDIGPNSGVKISAAPGSRLSAAWQRCRNATAGCGDGTLSLTFEDENQNYLVANSTYNWTATVASNRLAANTSMALISMDYGNASDYLWGFFGTNGVMGSTWQDYENGNWWWTSLGRNIMYGIPATASQGFAAASFRGRTCALVAALFGDGSVKVKYWDPAINNWHPEAKLKLLNESAETGFSTIAMTADARLYGKANSGTIQEFRMDQDDPYSFHYVGDVA
ncbi:hypothetical protein PG993_008689 [Apiospora rasikravindrae]|uniref:Fucose-specific lectin n=1 Tax=Apiospora rasikravindrae TaxID=990691 RepID=A0ABR1SP25_9PEZI